MDSQRTIFTTNYQFLIRFGPDLMLWAQLEIQGRAGSWSSGPNQAFRFRNCFCWERRAIQPAAGRHRPSAMGRPCFIGQPWFGGVLFCRPSTGIDFENAPCHIFVILCGQRPQVLDVFAQFCICFGMCQEKRRAGAWPDTSCCVFSICHGKAAVEGMSTWAAEMSSWSSCDVRVGS